MKGILMECIYHEHLLRVKCALFTGGLMLKSPLASYAKGGLLLQGLRLIQPVLTRTHAKMRERNYVSSGRMS